MIDVINLAEKADEYADAKIAQPGEFHPDWHKVRDERFAELALEEAAKTCDAAYWRNLGPAYGEVRYGISACAAAIRAMKPTERQS